jgi:3-hydroxyacyl-CoA dehydrogenase/enoyl-CoA hydratase/3-hydroxybutyryl-CoA epimerase/enoyl-CoA isomerase
MDTGSHVIDVISAGYPQRMRPPHRNAIRALVAARRLGQKSGGGFYDYDAAGGKPKRSASPAARELISQLQHGAQARLTDEEIVARTMLPMVLEAIRCLEDGVAASAAELDMAMLLGVGFPQYLGGPLQYADWLGLPQLVSRCEALAARGSMYDAPVLLRAMAGSGRRFYPVD